MEKAVQSGGIFSFTYAMHPGLRYLLGALLVLGYVGIVRYTWITNESANPFSVGDWLINYDQGFIRRGLGGTVLLYLQDAFHWPILRTLFVFKFLLYTLIFVAALKLTWRVREYSELILLGSPAAFLFPLFSWTAAGRKEILLFAVPAFFTLLPFRQRTERWYWTSGVVLITYLTFVLLVHEGLYFFFPLLGLYLYEWGKDSISWRRLLLVGAIWLSGVMAVVDLVSAAHTADISGMCQSLVERGVVIPNCDRPTLSSLSWLNTRLPEAWAFMRTRINVQQMTDFFASAMLVAVPFVLLRKEFNWKILTLVTAPLAVLFVIAIDWGRWVHMTTMFWAFIYFARRVNRVNSEMEPASTGIVIWQATLLLAWMLTWQLDFWCMAGVNWGAIPRLLHFLAVHYL